MNNLERLDEALADYENAVHKSEVVWDQKTIVAAARAYRDLLADGERVRWCEVHELGQATWYDPDQCPASEGDCRMVPMVLSNPTTEEKRPWHTNYNTGERCFCALGGDPATEEER